MKNILKRSCLLAVALCLLLSAFTGALALNMWGYVVTTGEVNVRKGPGLDYSSVKVIQQDSSLGYLGETSWDDRGVAWYKICYTQNNTGWVSSRYAELYQRKVIAADGDTYIRSYGNLEADQLSVLPQGAVASYMEDMEYDNRGVAWYKIGYNGHIGWVSSRYTEMTSANEPVYNRVVEASDGQSNLRTTPSLSGSEITVMKQGDTATYLNASSVDERGVTWYKVQYKGYSGWVSSRYTIMY